MANLEEARVGGTLATGKLKFRGGNDDRSDEIGSEMILVHVCCGFDHVSQSILSNRLNSLEWFASYT